MLLHLEVSGGVGRGRSRRRCTIGCHLGKKDFCFAEVVSGSDKWDEWVNSRIEAAGTSRAHGPV